jgi:hypothetical protein
MRKMVIHELGNKKEMQESYRGYLVIGGGKMAGGGRGAGDSSPL